MLLKNVLVIAFSALTACCSCQKKKESTGGGATNQFNVTVSTIAGKIGDHGNAEDGIGSAARFWNPTKMIYDNRNSTLYVADGTAIRSIDQNNEVKTYVPFTVLGNYDDIFDICLAPGTAGGTLYITTKYNDLWKIEPDGTSFKTTKIIDKDGGNETGNLNSGNELDGPHGVAIGKNGEIYVYNTYWNTLHRIRLTSLNPVTGSIEPFAGKPLDTEQGSSWPYKDGQGETATFNSRTMDIAADANGNIYVADDDNRLLRKVSTDGMVTSMFQYSLGDDKDGPVSVATSNGVTQVAANQDGSIIFFTSYGYFNQHPTLRMVRPGNDVITLAGEEHNMQDGDGQTAGFGTIGGIAATPDGKTVYVSEPGNKVIRKVTIQ
jgi:hypothetical protein